jgi:hypothetical protein
MKSPSQIFTAIFRGNKWRDKSSLSGSGSNLVQTAEIRSFLPLLVKELECKSLFDVPCGDFFWMKMVEMDIQYTGGDIVDELIQKNESQYGSENRKFICIDLIRDSLPKADLVLSRDCFVHFSYSHIFRALKNIKNSGSTYLLTTTFISRNKNFDIPTGSWRPINLYLSPFNFPLPLKMIDEKNPSDEYRDKNLGLWKVTDIPDFW